MVLSADHSKEWAQTCPEVLVTGLGFYNITGNKDIQPHPAHKKGPSAFPWMCGIGAFLHRPQAKPVFVLHPNPKMYHIFLLLVGGEKQKERKRKMG